MTLTDSPSRTLSEHDSKQLLAELGVPFPAEALAADADGAVREAESIGFPVVLKLNGNAIAHKTERDLVRLGLDDAAAVRTAAEELLAKARPEDGEVSLLVAEMVAGRRELIAGLVRDPQFGPCVLLGLGGILTEALGDAVFAAAPLSEAQDLDFVGEWAAANGQLVAHANLPRGLGPHPRDLDLAGVHRVGRQGAGLEESRRPKPFIQPNRVAHFGLRTTL